MNIKLREFVKKKDNQQGFTLVELIIVMAVLAVLAGIAVPKFTGVLAQSKKDANDVNVDMIVHAAQLYYDANDQTMVATVDALAAAGYLKENPKNPVTGTAKGYTITFTDNAAPAVDTLKIVPGKYKGGADGTTNQYTDGTTVNL